uniref:Uncharacterized protein n=1 Tax=Arundo donax TaxID=35708 RepID=A0A0A8YQI9_ARUDO
MSDPISMSSVIGKDSKSVSVAESMLS